MDDLRIARKYTAKADQAKSLGHDFTLSFAEYKRLMLKKTCAYSGIPFADVINVWASRTLDRVDSSLGYVSGNVVACTHGMNQIKSQAENPKIPIDFKTLAKGVVKIAAITEKSLRDKPKEVL